MSARFNKSLHPFSQNLWQTASLTESIENYLCKPAELTLNPWNSSLVFNLEADANLHGIYYFQLWGAEEWTWEALKNNLTNKCTMRWYHAVVDCILSKVPQVSWTSQGLQGFCRSELISKVSVPYSLLTVGYTPSIVLLFISHLDISHSRVNIHF